ncbi:DUF885 domain-containing protein [Marinicella sp. W31]|uniref:DUF885 domain-containing protein n=1 Tax=Marinicella sp. W31 TaxID=3023713 RepID=UPI003757E29A
MKKIILLVVAVICSVSVLQGCMPKNANDQVSLETTQPVSQLKEDQLINLYFKQSYQTVFAARPLDATLYSADVAAVGGLYQHRLDDYSPTAEARLRERIRRSSFQLEQATAWSVDKQEHKAILIDINQYYAGDKDFSIGYVDTWLGLAPFIVNQMNGPLINGPDTMLTNQPVTTVDEANDYLNRLKHFDTFVQSVGKKLQADAEQGWIPPKIILQKSILALEAFVGPAVGEHPLLDKLHQQLPQIKALSNADHQALIATARQYMDQRIYPAYQDIITQLRALLPEARSEAGIWAQPNGAAFYAQKVKRLGDTHLSPEQIHQYGRLEVERILQEMDIILKAHGRNQGTVAQRLLQLLQEPEFFYADSDTGRAQLLADINQYIEVMQAKAQTLFSMMPKAPVVVRRYSESREEFAAAGMYTSPSLDGNAPGIYWINLRDMKMHPNYGLKTLTYHEAFPGHHLQMGLNQELDDLPLLRRVAPYNAFVEGWALYAEKLAHEMGMYADDPMADLGRLQAELFRSARLVVDTGLHDKKWSREKAIQYMLDVTGKSKSEITLEVERYMVWPGQALGYKLGMQAILDMREFAQNNLGKSFDMRAFHDLVLKSGAVPIHFLDQKVRAWVRDVQKTEAQQKAMGLKHWQNLVCLETHCFLMKR